MKINKLLVIFFLFATASAFPQAPSTSDSWSKLGDEQFKERSYSKAIVSFSKAIELDADNKHAFRQRGSAYLLIKQYDSASKDFKSEIQIINSKLKKPGIRTRPEFQLKRRKIGSCLLMGLCFEKLRQYSKATDAYQKSIELDPKKTRKTTPLAFLGLGRSHYRLKKFDLAVKALDQCIFRNRNSDECLFYRGASYYSAVYCENKEKRLAVKDFSEAIRLKPKNLKYYRWRAAAYCSLAEKVLAKADEKAVIELGGNITAPCK